MNSNQKNVSSSSHEHGVAKFSLEKRTIERGIKKYQKERKTITEWKKTAIKVIENDEISLEEWCLREKSCRCLKWDSEKKEASIKMWKEEGTPILKAKTFDELFKLLKRAGQKLIICSKCPDERSEWYRTTTDIKTHLKTFHPNKVECLICKENGIKKLLHICEINDHVYKEHNNRCAKKETIIECSVCDEKVSKNNIKKHLQEKHPNYKRCKYCKGVNYIHKNEFKSHNLKCHSIKK